MPSKIDTGVGRIEGRGRRIRASLIAPGVLLLVAGCGAAGDGAATAERVAATPDGRAVEPEADEPRLRNLRMLTYGGENAEAYFSSDGRQLIFQATRPGESECDQIFTMSTAGEDPRMVSTGQGRTTCAYFYPSGDRILYSSTHASGSECPAPPDRSRGYVWALYDFDIYTAAPDGSDVELLFSSPRYDAEATISSDGEKIVFTSVRDGDIDI